MSEPCPQLREDLGGYVLGALEPDEAARVRAHLDSCPGCAAAYRELARLPELLDLSAGLEPAALRPPPGLEERLLDEVARESERPRRRLPRPRRPGAWGRRAGLAGGVAALAAAAVIGVVVLGDDGDGGGSGSEAPGYELALRAAAGAPGASARAGLEAVRERDRGAPVGQGARGRPRGRLRGSL